AVQFRPATSEETRLSAQDVDGDGDVDLLWSYPLHFAIAVVCFNNGLGHFDCLSPPRLGTPLTPPGTRFRHRPASALERMNTAPSTSSAQPPASLRGVPLVLVPQPLRHEPQGRSRSCIGNLTATRAPPSAAC